MDRFIYTLLVFAPLNVIAQSRSLAVENEIIVETANGIQTTQFLEAAGQSATQMNIITLVSLFLFISAPFFVYLVFQKHSVKKQQEKLHENVILMSDFAKKHKKSSSKNNEEHDQEESEDNRAA